MATNCFHSYSEGVNERGQRGVRQTIDCPGFEIYHGFIAGREVEEFCEPN
jgi:hypothetical protein